jgi:hypothetical protein
MVAYLLYRDTHFALHCTVFLEENNILYFNARPKSDFFLMLLCQFLQLVTVPLKYKLTRVSSHKPTKIDPYYNRYLTNLRHPFRLLLYT